jgi:hypothetical protein
MRVTRETLLRIAKEKAQEYMYNDPNLITAYLTGSLLTEEPFFGGLTDIDLVFVHTQMPAVRREIVKLTGDYHLDITYRGRKEYHPPRKLRTDPWLGYEIYDPLLLQEREHFFEFTQAAVRAGFEFNDPAATLARCHTLLSHGRQIWMDFMEQEGEVRPVEVAKYLKSVHHAVNAVAELSGPPLSERRLMLLFPQRAEAIGRPGFAAGLVGLLGGSGLEVETMRSWLSDWQADFLAAADKPEVDRRIQPVRLNYYLKGFEALLENEVPQAVLWPLVRTWTLAAAVLPESETTRWRQACTQLGLVGEPFETRLEGLDHFLDEIEEVMEEIATANGLESPASI